MYRLFIKPIILWLGNDQVRRIVLCWLYIVGRMPIIKDIVRAIYSSEHRTLQRRVFGVKFRNPIGLAAGFDNNGEVVEGLQSIGLGFVEVGTITAEPQRANPSPNIFTRPEDRAMIYRVGHPNKGWRFAMSNLRRKRKEIVVGCSISRNNNTPYRDAGKEILKSFRNLYQYTDYFTVVINFDQIALGDGESLSGELHKILMPLFDFRRGQREYRPIMLKLSPDLGQDQLDDVVEVLINSPLDGVVAVSGTESRESMVTPEVEVDAIGTGRVSGNPLRKRAVEVVRYIHEKSGGGYPIIAVGGVSKVEHIEEMMAAGASLVQIYTAFIYEGPSLVRRLCHELEERECQREHERLKKRVCDIIEEDIRGKERKKS